MQIITVTDDGTLRIELTAEEAKQLREELAERNWNSTAREFVRYVDALYGERRPPMFPGGGI